MAALPLEPPALVIDDVRDHNARGSIRVESTSEVEPLILVEVSVPERLPELDLQVQQVALERSPGSFQRQEHVDGGGLERLAHADDAEERHVVQHQERVLGIEGLVAAVQAEPDLLEHDKRVVLREPMLLPPPVLGLQVPFDDRPREARSDLDARVALRVGTGHFAADDHLEREHVALLGHEAGRVVATDVGEQVGPELPLEPLEHVAGDDVREEVLALDHIVSRAVPGRDVALRLHDRIPRIVHGPVDLLGLAGVDQLTPLDGTRIGHRNLLGRKVTKKVPRNKDASRRAGCRRVASLPRGTRESLLHLQLLDVAVQLPDLAVQLLELDRGLEQREQRAGREHERGVLRAVPYEDDHPSAHHDSEPPEDVHHNPHNEGDKSIANRRKNITKKSLFVNGLH